MSTNLVETSKNYNTYLKCLKSLENIKLGKVVKCINCCSEETINAKGDLGKHACRC